MRVLPTDAVPVVKTDGPWIKDEIFARMDTLSPAEKRVARSILADYPSAGLASAALLAKAAGTSAPTVLRFAARLGCGSYPEFQKRLLDEITHSMSSPVSRSTRARAEGADGGDFSTALNYRIQLAQRLTASVPPSEFDEAVRLLAGSPRDVIISGGYFSRQIAQILAFQLDQIISNVEFAGDPLGHDVSKYLELRRDSVAIIFDMRRYELSAKQTSALVKKRGATLIVITDQELSPSAEAAAVVLSVPVDGIPFDSNIALLALIECLVEAVFLERGHKALERMVLWENAIRIHRAFRASGD